MTHALQLNMQRRCEKKSEQGGAKNCIVSQLQKREVRAAKVTTMSLSLTGAYQHYPQKTVGNSLETAYL
jgi:hypothetical protein